MTLLALEALAADVSTEAVVIVSKPPAPSMVPRLEDAVRSLRKPCVVFLAGGDAGAKSAPAAGLTQPAPALVRVATLEDAAEATVAVLHGRAWTPRVFSDPGAIRARLAAVTAGGRPRGALLGLFTGGTLGQEARLILEPLLGPIAANFGEPVEARHLILDLGADEFTRGRPHPMIDPSARDTRVREAGANGGVGVLLVDLVLGRAAHSDPARSLAAAIREARRTAERAGRSLVPIASVIGTEGDPQGLAAQVAALEEAGVEVLPSSAQAARFAALTLDPALSSRLLGP
jgi:FdrA protein